MGGGGKKKNKAEEAKEKEEKLDKMETQSVSVLMQSQIGNESMVKRHANRVRDEQLAKQNRQEERPNVINVQMGIHKPALFMFD